MHRKGLVAAALLLAACGVDPSEDDRPRNLQYITVTVLKPYCAAAQCHSSFRQVKNRAFDTVAAACATLVTQKDVLPGDPEGSFLISVMTRTVKKMPYDQPMPTVDRALIADWILTGAVGLPDPATATAEDCP